MLLQTNELLQLLAERVEPIDTARDLPFWASVRRVVNAKGRYLRKGTGKRNVDAWEHAIRALRALRDPENRAAVEAAERLGGTRAVASMIAELGRKPREKLPPGEVRRRQAQGRDRRSEKLAKTAAARLSAARMTLAKALRAVSRAEDLVKKWGERVAYHRKNGRLPEEEEG